MPKHNEWNVPENEQQGSNGQFDFRKVETERIFTMAKLAKRPQSSLKLCGQVIATPGNLVSLYAQAKSGKTGVIGAMLAAVMAQGDESYDLLGFQSAINRDGHALIYIDTEQPRYEFEQVVLKALKRVELEDPPPWLLAYGLVGLCPGDLQHFIGSILPKAKKEHGGVFGVFIDGIGDLVSDVNKVDEANQLITNFQDLVVEYQMITVGAIHENPGEQQRDKMRGHLGSQFERKAQSNIRISATNKDGIFVCHTTKSRNAHISKTRGQQFKWCAKQEMHVSCYDEGADEKSQKAKEEKRQYAAEIFDCEEAATQAGGLTWSQMRDRIIKTRGKTKCAAEKDITRLGNAGVLERSGDFWFLLK